MTGDADRMERLVGTVLRIGASISTVILTTGLVLYLIDPGSSLAGRVLRAGLIALMATPVGRVVASVIEYTVERDWLFAAITGTVLLVLLGSLLFGVG